MVFEAMVFLPLMHVIAMRERKKLHGFHWRMLLCSSLWAFLLALFCLVGVGGRVLIGVLLAVGKQYGLLG